MHERFCVMNVKKCCICNEPINIDEEEEHVTEFHSEIACKHCKKSFKKDILAEHMIKCDQKEIECKYCLLNVTIRDKRDHEYACGAKTEICLNCKKYVALKDFEKHESYQCFPDEILLANQIDINKIPVIPNKKNTKLKKIALANNLGLLHNQKPSTGIKKIDTILNTPLPSKNLNSIDTNKENKIPISSISSRGNYDLKNIKMPTSRVKEAKEELTPIANKQINSKIKANLPKKLNMPYSKVERENEDESNNNLKNKKITGKPTSNTKSSIGKNEKSNFNELKKNINVL